MPKLIRASLSGSRTLASHGAECLEVRSQAENEVPGNGALPKKLAQHYVRWSLPCQAPNRCSLKAGTGLRTGVPQRRGVYDNLKRMVGEKVRREKALDFSGCNSRPGTGSLHPVAIETIVEVTKLSELSMERVAWRLGERAGHNVSER
jgi:hypothetical protein